ncbi:unnamed protein product [Acanthoscelides obtectus]|uniref:Uncharacterized protein n=1 Tax=Acanthoscelides obtectus TaxID=200917 RepID=A0A9P0L131_ACAOB|nr:unnamed protein product [Acanthoscelides obtectus]CAK1670677.1 hypothetical protein AOBTE_LOCUS27753 [Acanthoscelides obtectus]
MCDIWNLIVCDTDNNSAVGGGDSSDSCISDGEMDSEPSAPSPKSATPTSSAANGNGPSTRPPILSPLMYQTPQGMMYAATPSGGGVILGLAQPEDGATHPQFITIPLSMMGAQQHQQNGQSAELDLSKRK